MKGLKLMKGILSFLVPLFLLIGCSSEILDPVLDDILSEPTPKLGLLVVTLTVKDADKFNNEYFPGASETLATASATSVFKGVSPEALHGENDKKVIVAFKFSDQDAIKSWYDSPEYQALIPVRLEAADMVFTSYEVASESDVIGDGILAVSITVRDQEKFDSYFAQAQPTLAEYGAMLQFKGVKPEVLHGVNTYKVIALFRFESKEKIIEWYNSPAYQALIPLRLEAADMVFTAYEVAG
jgi:uncharacterized protein (DUF1330 family)